MSEISSAWKQGRIRWGFPLLAVLFVAIIGMPANAKDDANALALILRSLEQTDSSQVRSSLLRGMLAGLEGRRNVQTPPGWQRVRRTLQNDADPQVKQLADRMAQVFGDPLATAKALSVLRDAKVDAAKRREALTGLLEQRNAEVSGELESLLDDAELAMDAIRGYAVIENAAAPAILLSRYSRMTADHQRATIETLATRKSYAKRLIDAIEQGAVSRDGIPMQVARSLGEMEPQRFARVFGKIRPVGEEREKLLAKYKKMLTDKAIASADASRGRVVFEQTCAACHLMYGQGGKVGPDLTGSNRANLDYILLNSVDPSYDVPDAYKMVQILTVEGRVVSGVLAEEDEVRVVLKTAQQPRVVIAKSDIETRRISDKSLMPEGQLDQLQPKQVIDLIKYLRTKEQVEPAK